MLISINAYIIEISLGCCLSRARMQAYQATKRCRCSRPAPRLGQASAQVGLTATHRRRIRAAQPAHRRRPDESTKLAHGVADELVQGARTRKRPALCPRPHLDEPSPRIVKQRPRQSTVVILAFVFLLGRRMGSRARCMRWS